MDKKIIDAYWNAFLDKDDNRTKYTGPAPEAWYFCNNEKDANELLDLVLRGIKRGTASMEECYERDGEPVPAVGDLSIITNWAGIPHCIIESIKVTILPFADVTEEMAAIEGEGDKSLEYWRKGHEGFFGEELQEWGKEFSEDVRVVFEEFRVIYK